MEMTGEFVNNRTYGTQFKAGAFRVVQPMEAEGVVRFLASKLKHVGILPVLIPRKQQITTPLAV